MTDTTTLTETDYARIYAAFERAFIKKDLDQADAEGYHPDPEETLEAVQQLYGEDALRQILTGRSPRA